MQCKSFNFAPFWLFAYYKRDILPFKSLFWLQPSLVFVGNIHAMNCFFLCYTALARESSLWQCYRRWLHRRVSFRQLTVQPATRVRSGRRGFRFSEPSKMIVIVARCEQGGSQWDQLSLVVTYLCLSCRSNCPFCMLLLFYAMFVMLYLFILCYLCRTIALVATAIFVPDVK